VTKQRGKSAKKLLAISDSTGLPISVYIASTASPHHEVTLTEATIFTKCFVSNNEKPERLIGEDKAYDSDPLDEKLTIEYGIEMIPPHRFNRHRSRTQDGRSLRRYKHRWKIERLFAWLHNFRRIPLRYEYHTENYLSLVQLGCTMILLRMCLCDEFYYISNNYCLHAYLIPPISLTERYANSAPQKSHLKLAAFATGLYRGSFM
jgi:transposase